MDRKKIERFWEHPVRYILRFFLAVTTMCILLTYMPKWFNFVCTIVLVVITTRMVIRWEKKQETKD